MTVCIAALFDNGKGAVLAADGMITSQYPIAYEFENDETNKIYPLCQNSYAMFAGNMMFGAAIVELAKAQIDSLGIGNVSGVATSVRNAYTDYRSRFIEQVHLAPRGLSLDSYHQRHNFLNGGLIQVIDNAMIGENIGVEFIVVGPSNAGFGIYIVSHPGIAICMDAIGFCALGSGEPHATFSLMGSLYRKSVKQQEAEKLVTQAMKMSEAAPGVGKETSRRVLIYKESADDTDQEE